MTRLQTGRIRRTLAGLAVVTALAAATAVTVPSTAYAASYSAEAARCAQAAKDAGFVKDNADQGRNDNAVYAVAVALAESNCDPNADHENGPNDPDPGSHDLGAWQINNKWYPDANDHRGDLDWSARKAYAIDNDGSGRGWASWAAYNNGTYRDHLDDARAAVYAIYG